MNKPRENPIVDFAVNVELLADARCVVALRGEVDLYTAPAFEGELADAVESGARDVTVDLTDASFIDSALLGVLTAAQKRLDSLGGHISIVCADPNLTKVFEITGLDNVFAIRSTRDEEPRVRTIA